MKKLISIAGMTLVRAWLNVREHRMERSYEGQDGTHVLWTAAYDPNSAEPVFGNATVKEMSTDDLNGWYTIAIGDVERSGQNPTFKDSPKN